jgi:hypothetical protein
MKLLFAGLRRKSTKGRKIYRKYLEDSEKKGPAKSVPDPTRLRQVESGRFEWRQR